jgi:hypothetical protein
MTEEIEEFTKQMVEIYKEFAAERVVHYHGHVAIRAGGWGAGDVGEDRGNCGDDGDCGIAEGEGRGERGNAMVVVLGEL